MKLSQIPEGSFYAGIGSRETPLEICDLMGKIAEKLWIKHSFILRSGGAPGADQAFSNGLEGKNTKKEIYLPWKGFNKIEGIVIKDEDIIKKSEIIAEKYHLGWKFLKDAARKFMIRNTYQVLGGDLNTFSEFVLCWTKDGANGKEIETTCKTGGTGQAIRIAAAYNIPVINLNNSQKFDAWSKWVNV